MLLKEQLLEIIKKGDVGHYTGNSINIKNSFNTVREGMFYHSLLKQGININDENVVKNKVIEILARDLGKVAEKRK